MMINPSLQEVYVRPTEKIIDPLALTQKSNQLYVPEKERRAYLET